jgi:hypothetical protein
MVACVANVFAQIENAFPGSSTSSSAPRGDAKFDQNSSGRLREESDVVHHRVAAVCQNGDARDREAIRV